MNNNFYYFHDYYLKKYGSNRRYPKEIHKIVYEDEKYGTCAILVNHLCSQYHSIYIFFLIYNKFNFYII